MKFRIATFNVENLFSRPKAMNEPSWSTGQPAIDAAGQLNALFNHDVYSAADKQQMLTLLAAHNLLKTRPNDEYLNLVKIRGKLFALPQNQPPVIVANGRANWVGWVELKKEAIRAAAIENTARVIEDVDADVLSVVEVEDRPTLRRFHDAVLAPRLKAAGKKPYPYDMVVDGNDDRGIDVGILSRFPIRAVRSHIWDRTPTGAKTFSRDCPEYYVELPNGKELVVLPNHFASKGSDTTGARRKVQSTAVAAIYAAVSQTHPLVLVSGDLNDHPAGGSLHALLQTNLTDAMSLPVYTQKGDYPGTYEHGNASQKFDYLLMSPTLAGAVKDVGVERRGFYAPTKWQSYPGITSANKDLTQASDHHCVWADVDVP